MTTLHHRFDPYRLALPLSLAFTVLVAIAGVATGLGWIRLLFFLPFGCSISLAVDEYRRARISPTIGLTQAGVIVVALHDAGLLADGMADLEVTQHPDGHVVTTTTSGRYVVGLDGRVYRLPPSCSTPGQFFEQFRSAQARAAHVVDSRVGR